MKQRRSSKTSGYLIPYIQNKSQPPHFHIQLVTAIILRIVNTTPLLKDLQNHISPNYAAHWRVIGTQLGLHKGRLDIIEHDNYHKAERCCDAVLEEWLEVDSTATWNKLLGIINFPSVSGNQDLEEGNYLLIV